MKGLQNYIGLGMLAAVALGTAGCSSLNMNNIAWDRVAAGAAKTAQAASITDQEMAAYVAQSVKDMDAKGNVAPANSAYTKRLNKLVADLKEADGIPLNFKVYQTKEVNAFACPDGSVRVYSGLMDIMNDDELLGIIGHEIGHVVKRHSKNAFKNSLLTSAVRDGIASTGGVVGALSDSALGQLGEAYVNSRFSQKQENEADDCAYDFLVAKQVNPWGMVMAFEKFDAMEQQGGGAGGSYVAKMFSSHPETRERIAHITSRCVKDKYVRPTAK